jgi:mannose-6-phosphate isomerase-like protein (cupin superfamily)
MRKMPAGVEKGIWPLEPITRQDLHLDQVFYEPYFYEQFLVMRIWERLHDGEILQSSVNSHGEWRALGDYVPPQTFKIEGMERINKKVWKILNEIVNGKNPEDLSPVSCHVFMAEQGSPSFPDHTDPDDVMIYVIEGQKKIIAEGVEYILNPGEYIWLPHGTVHRAVNDKESVMLSIGFDRYHMEKIYA